MNNTKSLPSAGIFFCLKILLCNKILLYLCIEKTEPMAIIKLTELTYKTIDPTKTGFNNQELVNSKEILFNTTEMITAEPHECGGSKVTYKKALVSSFICKESIASIQYKIVEANG